MARLASGPAAAAVPRDASSEVTPGPPPTPSRRSPPHPRRLRRALLALSAVGLTEIVGTLGFHLIEGRGWVDSFYFESMLATGQGPPAQLNTDAGKIFASVMGFVSVGSTLSAVVFAFGPILSRLWRVALLDIEVAARHLGREVQHEVREIEEEVR